ncbi:tail terminator [Providencia phage Kokobel1]|uniref:Uncharacterized protein n=1 Tax=Providencia phage Kokobel1 TaxID=2783540 RepID=A0A873WG77_9CAUD|nr:tail terminator [Providencia phage Kokobel1]QPB11453.1 hypothetical protein [Providencia phage Kokobel1]
MASSKKLEILIHLTQLLEEVKQSEGAEFDLKGCVFRGRTVFGDNDPIPTISILEAKGASFADYADDYKIINKTGWNLLIQGFADNPDDPKHETDVVYRMVEDVKSALNKITMVSGAMQKPCYPEHYLLGGKIFELTLGDEVVRPSEIELSSKAFFYLPIVIGITNSKRGSANG